MKTYPYIKTCFNVHVLASSERLDQPALRHKLVGAWAACTQKREDVDEGPGKKFRNLLPLDSYAWLNAGQASQGICALSVLHVVIKVLKLTLEYQIRYLHIIVVFFLFDEY